MDGIDQIGTTLCLPTPGKSAMKSVLKAAPAAGEDQQQLGSPLPRGRRVSVKSPEAIRMDVEEGEDEMKRNLIKEIVRTPGFALRSTSRRPRATPAPLPTPAAGTLRRSQRSIRKTEKAMEVEVSTTKRSTRKTARSKVMFDLDQEETDSTELKEEKVQEAEPKGESDFLPLISMFDCSIAWRQFLNFDASFVIMQVLLLTRSVMTLRRRRKLQSFRKKETAKRTNQSREMKVIIYVTDSGYCYKLVSVLFENSY